jgi:hypothetical protein
MQEDEPETPETSGEELPHDGGAQADYGDEDADAEADYRHYDGDGYTSSDFHNVIQKQVLNATYETLVETKLHWALIEPFLHAAREMALGDFRRTGRVRIHGVSAEGEGWVDSEEAYVSLSIADQDDGHEWLTETWWLSDLVLAGGEPDEVREAAQALQRTVEKLNAWLSENEKGPDEAG